MPGTTPNAGETRYHDIVNVILVCRHGPRIIAGALTTVGIITTRYPPGLGRTSRAIRVQRSKPSALAHRAAGEL